LVGVFVVVVYLLFDFVGIVCKVDGFDGSLYWVVMGIGVVLVVVGLLFI